MQTILVTLPQAAARNALVPVPRAQKASEHAAFNHEDRAHDDAGAAQERSAHSARESRNETAEHVPLWYGPKLRPLFVTQLLGQMLTASEVRDQCSAVVAYGEHARKIAPALLLDLRA